MRIILKDCEYDINSPTVEIEKIDDETVLYFTDEEKIAVLNCTATVIWKIITDALQHKQLVIILDEIIEKFEKIVDISNLDSSEIELDIDSIIKQFIENGVFIY